MAFRVLFMTILLVLSSGVFMQLVRCQESHERKDFQVIKPQNPQQISTVKLCEASDESPEECEDYMHLGQGFKRKLPKFLLYKWENSTGHYVALSKNSDLIHREGMPIKGAVWKILIHGFLNNGNSTFPVNVRDAYVNRMRRNMGREQYNILVVDWGELACYSLSNVQGNFHDYGVTDSWANVGKAVGKFLVFLQLNGILDLTKEAHLIGFSVGAHVAGQAGRHVVEALGKSVHRITALDPAGGAFWAWKLLPVSILPQRRLQRTDAKFVDTYHSSSRFGSVHKAGHVDFWINGGQSQPSCVPKILTYFSLLREFAQACSHNYVTTLYANSIDDTSLRGCLCSSYRAYTWGTCNCEKTAVFGEFIDTSTTGEYFVDTPPDEKAIANWLASWQNFSASHLVQQLRAMICYEEDVNIASDDD